MKTFNQRRVSHLLIIGLASAVCWVIWRLQRDALMAASFSTGYTLGAIILFLIAFHWRKKLNVFPIGSASTWMQIHIYLGLLAIPIFVIHLGFRWPDGMFETALAGLFAMVTASGLGGLYITRTFPKRLNTTSEEFFFDQIPAHRHQLQQTTRNLVTNSIETLHTTTLAEFYANRLSEYFERPRGIRFLVFPDTRLRRTLMSELGSLQRYLSDAERSVSDQLFRLIRKKDDLDYQYALQWMLKSWLVIHLALSYGLITFTLVHVLIAHRFHGGW